MVKTRISHSGPAILHDSKSTIQSFAVHGLPEEALVAQQSPGSSLKDRLIGKLVLLSKLKSLSVDEKVCVVTIGAISVECLAVTIKCPDHPEQKQLIKKLPGTMTIQKLKGLLQRMYRVNSSDQKLSYVDKRVSMQTHIYTWLIPIK